MVRFTVTGTALVIWASVREDCVVVGMGGLSLIFTVSGDADVPLMLVPEIVSEYTVFR